MVMWKYYSFHAANTELIAKQYMQVRVVCSDLVGRCGVVTVVVSTLAFGSMGHGFEPEHRLFSHHGASAFSKLRSLANCSLDDSVRRLL